MPRPRIHRTKCAPPGWPPASRIKWGPGEDLAPPGRCYKSFLCGWVYLRGHVWGSPLGEQFWGRCPLRSPVCVVDLRQGPQRSRSPYFPLWTLLLQEPGGAAEKQVFTVDQESEACHKSGGRLSCPATPGTLRAAGMGLGVGSRLRPSGLGSGPGPQAGALQQGEAGP